MKRTAVIVLSFALVMVLTTGVLAKGWGPGGGRGYGKGQWAQQLTDEQRTKLQAARAAFMQETLELRQTMATKGQELRTIMVQKDFDQAKAKALAYEMVDLRSQMAKKMIDHRISLKNELGIDLPMGGFGGKRGRFGRGGPGGGMSGFGPGMGGWGQGGGHMARGW
jgi:Spy/CpxP family protein refolding chaperone